MQTCLFFCVFCHKFWFANPSGWKDITFLRKMGIRCHRNALSDRNTSSIEKIFRFTVWVHYRNFLESPVEIQQPCQFWPSPILSNLKTCTAKPMFQKTKTLVNKPYSRCENISIPPYCASKNYNKIILSKPQLNKKILRKDLNLLIK